MRSTRINYKPSQIIFAIMLMASLLTSCGAPRGSGFKGTTDLSPQTAKKRAQSKSQTGQSNVNTQNGGSQNIAIDEGNNGISSQCQSAINQVHSLSQACSAILFANDDVVPSSCLTAFSNLNLVNCSNLNASVTNAKNACNATFQQFANELPSNCRAAIQGLGG